RLCHTHYPVCLYSLSTDSAHHHVLPSLPTRRSSDLGAFHERHDVAHAEDAVGHAFRMENLKGVHLLARRDEFERLVHHRTDGDGSTAAGVAVELGEHHAVVVEPVVELPRGVHRILPSHGIHHEERFGGFRRLFDGGNLLHHGFVHRQAAGRIDDDRIDVLAACVFDGVFGDFHGVFVPLFGIDLHAYLLAEYLELLDGGRTRSG